MRAYLASLFVVVACGGSSHGLADAQGSDSASPDAALPSVSVTVTLMQAPQAGLPVYFLNPDSSVVSSTMTDATGTATAMMNAGGSVTVIGPVLPSATASGNVYTWESVRGGDKLELDLDNFAVTAGATVSVTIPTDTTGTAITKYTLYSSCSQDTVTTDGANSVTLVGCGATSDLLLVSYAGNVPVDEIFQAAVPIADGDTVTFAGPYTALGQVAYSYTNALADQESVDVSETLITTTGRLYSAEVANATIDAGTMTAMASSPFPVVTGSTNVIESDFEPTVGAFGALSVIDWGTASTTYALDVSTVALPEYASAPTVVAVTHEIEWTEANGGVTPDFTWATVEVAREGATPPMWSWQIMDSHPPNDQLKMPTLPTDLFDYNVGPSDNATVDGLVSGKVPGGYDAIRPIIYDIDGPQDIVAGATGTAAIQQLAAPEVSGPVRNPIRHRR